MRIDKPREICKKASEGDRDTYINTKNSLKALLKTLYATPNEKEPDQTTEDYPTTTNTAESDNS
ncbi:hypothetical protein PsorP6_011698 [Peronosclerospora sorghi]|uniref:Uncharacterized protein n=1 Tax=Peronosclerospora sorghi TaxID=230839 RepID=A0ACC0WLK9_9STRA|nr:hypothetical protein PsorP6_011698 [Peronosclerospora sorghi]